MRWRWLIFDYVDPALGLSREQRRQVRRRAHSTRWSRLPPPKPVTERTLREDLAHLIHGGRPLVWGSALHAIGALAVPLPVWGLWLLFASKGHVSLVAMVLLHNLISWVLGAFLGSYSWRPRVVAALRELGYEVCAGCGYDLRASNEATRSCPECGADRAELARLYSFDEPDS